jgi:hypothetical protein
MGELTHCYFALRQKRVGVVLEENILVIYDMCPVNPTDGEEVKCHLHAKKNCSQKTNISKSLVSSFCAERKPIN